MPITAIIPTYRSPAYLDLCLKSAVENRNLSSTDICVIVDGYVNESLSVIKKYEGRRIGVIELDQNGGMANALNMGVYNANTDIVFIVNDDNVFPKEWDTRLSKYEHNILSKKTVLTVNQIEPAQSIFGFPVHNFGNTAETFDYAEFLQKEEEIQRPEMSLDGRIFPFLISKRNYMMVGGFDLFFKSPFWVDVDFWLKLELAECQFFRTFSCHLYHFGSKATKMGPDGQKFRASESVAGQQFVYKWGHLPNVVENVFRNNTKIPKGNPRINGIQY